MATIRQEGPIIEETAGAALGGHRVVVRRAGVVEYADRTNAAHLGLVVGITRGAVGSGETTEVQVYGPMREASWTWTADLPIFVGTNGTLTQTPPTSGFSQQVAVAKNATDIFIDLQPPTALV